MIYLLFENNNICYYFSLLCSGSRTLTDPPPLKGPVGGSGSESFWTNFMLAFIYVQSKVHSLMNFDFRPQIWVLWTKKNYKFFFQKFF